MHMPTHMLGEDPIPESFAVLCQLMAICLPWCHRFGAKTVWIIRVCMVLLAPVAWPLAFILDKVWPPACPCCHQHILVWSTKKGGQAAFSCPHRGHRLLITHLNMSLPTVLKLARRLDTCLGPDICNMQILGREVGNFYTRSELKHLIQMHVENPEHPVSCVAYMAKCATSRGQSRSVIPS